MIHVGLLGRLVMLTCALGITGVVAAEAPRVDLEAAVKAGEKMRERLAMKPASWSVANTLSNGAVITAEMLRAGDKQRMVFTITAGGSTVEVLRIIDRDGVWYTTDPYGSCKYRPYEAPVMLSWIYVCMGWAEPLFVTPKMAGALGTCEKIEGRVATFRKPIDPAVAEQLRKAARQLEEIVRQSGAPASAEATKQIAQIKDLLEHGETTRVDVADGRLVEFGTQKLRSRVTDFRLLERVDEKDFAVAGKSWQDFSDDPTLGNLNDLVMIGHAPVVKPGARDYDLDGQLMDVTTGRFRRIPFPGGGVTAGCFLPDRKSVIVFGMDSAHQGTVRPFQINLKTRECRTLGGALLDSGSTIGADLSPDGKTLATMHLGTSGDLLKFQVCLIDLASGQAKILGKPADMGMVNWTSDGQHLVFVQRTYKDLTSDVTPSLAMMDMQGHVTTLRPGNFPVLLADRQTILFEDPETRVWRTCDLKGENVKLFGDGRKGYGFPAPASDGKRILMMHFVPGKLPEPVVVPVGEGEEKAITRVGGGWGLPAWR